MTSLQDSSSKVLEQLDRNDYLFTTATHSKEGQNTRGDILFYFYDFISIHTTLIKVFILSGGSALKNPECQHNTQPPCH